MIQTTCYGFQPAYFPARDHPHSILPSPMRWIKANYHAVQVLKNARLKLRKAIVSNCNKDLLHSISECLLNVLNGNIRVTDCAKRKLKRFKSSLRSLVDIRLPLVSRRRDNTTGRLPATAIVRGVAKPCQSAVPTSSQQTIMTLRKMNLIPSAAYDAGRLLSQPPPVKTKPVAKRSGRTAIQHPHDKWVALRTKLLEADINEADLMRRFADFLRMVLPPPKVPQRLPSAEQPTKIETLEIAERPR